MTASVLQFLPWSRPRSEATASAGERKLPEPELDEAPEFVASYRIEVSVLNERIAHRRGQDGKPARDATVDALLAEEPTTLYRLYEAEQRLALLMSDEEIEGNSEGLFARAALYRVPTLQVLQASFNQTQNPAIRRGNYVSLLSQLHRSHQQHLLDRRNRRKVAQMFNRVGASIIIVSAVVLSLLYLAGRIDELLGGYHLLAVMFCGLIGAFLSRMIELQKVLATVGSEEIATEFSGFALALRLIIGTLGALVMYFLIVGEVIGGEFFPAWTVETPIWQGGDVATDGGVGDFMVVSSAFAQLLIWSLLAGFSERIIPDRFARMEIAVVQPRR
jgi:hypothetical protein